MPEAGRRRRAPPSQIQITFTLRAKDQFSKERGRATRRPRRGRGDGRQWREAGSGRTGGRGRGARSPRSWRGRKGSGRRAGGRAGGRATRDAPEIHGQGGLNGRAALAGRPLGSCYTARAPAAAQPRRRRAHAARRGPRGHDDARGARSALGPHSLAAQPGGKGSSAGGEGGLSSPRVISRPLRSPPALEGPGQGCAALRPAGPSRPAPGPAPNSCGPPALPHASGLRALDQIWPREPGPHPHSPLGPSTSRNMTVCQGEATLGGTPREPCCPPPPPCE